MTRAPARSDSGRSRGESRRRLPVMQRDEVEVGDLHRRPQLKHKESQGSTRLLLETQQTLHGNTYVVVGDQGVGVVLRRQWNVRSRETRSWLKFYFVWPFPSVNVSNRQQGTKRQTVICSKPSWCKLNNHPSHKQAPTHSLDTGRGHKRKGHLGL